MNALLLAGAAAGALAALAVAHASLPTEPWHGAPESRSADRGSMTRTVNVDPQTGKVDETSVIAFLD